jgi:DNA recombination protein RmuC|tara:strand:+ start:62 stop:1117 length:1056 start_codon:yes stop_codon:yes gene_type:complete
MDNLLIILVVILLLANFAVLYLHFKSKPKQDENVAEKFKEEINSLKNSFNESFSSMSKEVAKDMTGALTRVDEKVGVFNQQIESLNKSQENFSRILAGVKQYGVLAEFSLASLLSDLLPVSQYIANVKMKPDETSDTVEFAVKLQDNVLCPIDSHWPIEKFKAIDEAYQAKDKDALSEARKDLAATFKNKAKKVSEKYVMPPKTTDFAIVYAPTEGLYAELASYRDPKTKELLMEELRTKYKITVAGPNTLCAILQAYHLGFQTLKVQKHATQIHDDLKNITSRFTKHFDGIIGLRKKLEEAMKVTDDFGRDARSIMRTLENIKDPEEIEKATKEENVEKIDFKDKSNLSG